MNIMVITSSPNKNGLTAACGQAAVEGAEAGGANVVTVSLNDFDISSCHACGTGYGTCSSKHECQVGDDFQELHKLFATMDGYIVVTPVYWGDLSESAKAFFDRLRRCEATNREKNNSEGKPVICVAAAGGSGNGTLPCLSTMERLFIHMRAERFDYISITRKTRSYKLQTIRQASEAMTEFMSSSK